MRQWWCVVLKVFKRELKYLQNNSLWQLMMVCTFVYLLYYAAQSEAKRSRQVVTDAERDYAMSGKFDQLLEEQRRIDAERDAEVN